MHPEEINIDVKAKPGDSVLVKMPNKKSERGTIYFITAIIYSESVSTCKYRILLDRKSLDGSNIFLEVTDEKLYP